jgi:hypothetical protein
LLVPRWRGFLNIHGDNARDGDRDHNDKSYTIG